jgi:hypothetical protein
MLSSLLASLAPTQRCDASVALLSSIRGWGLASSGLSLRRCITQRGPYRCLHCTALCRMEDCLNIELTGSRTRRRRSVTLPGRYRVTSGELIRRSCSFSLYPNWVASSWKHFYNYLL